MIVGLGATLDEQLLGGPIGDLSIHVVSDLSLDLLAFCSLILSKAVCIFADSFRVAITNYDIFVHNSS